MKLHEKLNSLIGKEITADDIKDISTMIDVDIKAPFQKELDRSNKELGAFKEAQKESSLLEAFKSAGGNIEKFESFKKVAGEIEDIEKYDFKEAFNEFPNLAIEKPTLDISNQHDGDNEIDPDDAVPKYFVG